LTDVWYTHYTVTEYSAILMRHCALISLLGAKYCDQRVCLSVRISWNPR